MKKLLLLGGSYTLLPIIRRARSYGWYVITMDYLPDNIAHRHSDEYVNLSVIDKDAVLDYAQSNAIDAISSFGCDAGAVTAAFVAEIMNLPYVCSYKAACVLQDKSTFREFLKENLFNVPKAIGCKTLEEAQKRITDFCWPVIVKPVDSAGSKGVTRCDTMEELPNAVSCALENGHNGSFIVEEFLEKEGPSSGSETFAVNGVAVYNGVYDQFFDPKAPNPYVPAAECWPSSHSQQIQDEVYSEVNRLFGLLHIKTGIFNVEWRVSKGKAYLMEVTPRGGGNRLAEMLSLATDSDVIDLEVRQMLGMSLPKIHQPYYKGYFANLVLHANSTGYYDYVEYKTFFKERYVLEEDLWVKKNEMVEAWSGGNRSIGVLFLKFKTREEMMEILRHIDNYVDVVVRTNIHYNEK